MTLPTWSELALGDLQAIGDFIAERDPSAAERVVEAIRATTHHLARHPRIGSPLEPSGYRKLSVQGLPCVVVYLTKDTDVTIVRVWHSARDWRSN